MGADSALETVKGKAARQMVDNALSHVRAIKARALSGQTIDAFTVFANETHSQLVNLLTPAPAPAPVKVKAPAIDWKTRAMKAETAHAALMAHTLNLEAMLQALKVDAPAIPVGATLAPAPTEPAPM